GVRRASPPVVGSSLGGLTRGRAAVSTDFAAVRIRVGRATRRLACPTARWPVHREGRVAPAATLHRLPTPSTLRARDAEGPTAGRGSSGGCTPPSEKKPPSGRARIVVGPAIRRD